MNEKLSRKNVWPLTFRSHCQFSQWRLCAIVRGLREKGEGICQYDCLSNTDIIHDIVLILTHYSSVRDASKSEASLQHSILYVMCHLAISYLQRSVVCRNQIVHARHTWLWTQETTEIGMVTTCEFGSRYFQIEFRLSMQQHNYS